MLFFSDCASKFPPTINRPLQETAYLAWVIKFKLHFFSHDTLQHKDIQPTDEDRVVPKTFKPVSLHLLVYTFNKKKVVEKVIPCLGTYIPSPFIHSFIHSLNACNKLHNIWHSNIANTTELVFFRACVESILLYGAETWTMNKEFGDRLEGTYTRLLIRVQNISWREHKTTEQIYGDISPISTTVAHRRVHSQVTAFVPKTRLFLTCYIGDCHALIEDLDHSTTST